ncbi:polysaccharide deacetylase family protein [Phytoactinopolyspora alkaliphila]|uniref:Polysaccharide deacetylase family protein n=1 Tax=Phytoactinopolyspora alkaliphila TaxID=1783498 RepID=A0A6N9YRD8_9ACTN|nr:polysaccharide deacetylase family protein [Phytoactinopolyspora alkaliphila]NED97626.1 polysaccharide deacetylase family protein [Phytoactinopolyspora alkaliphila]
MKVTGPVLAGCVIGLIAFNMGNGAGETSDDVARGAGDGVVSDGNSADDERNSGDDDRNSGDSPGDDGTRGDDHDGEDHPGFPDTGGASVPDLPVASDGTASVTLTFDDGPHPVHTPQILDMLAAHDTTAVFCVVGEKVDERPELVRRIVAEGHTLCNHSYHHDVDLSQKPSDMIEKDLEDTLVAIEKAAPGAPVHFFRQPGMFVTAEVAPVADKYGLEILDWTVDPRDWKRPEARTIVERVTDQVHPGAVILLHDGGGDRTETVKALAQILVVLEAAGYQAVVPAPS